MFITSQIRVLNIFDSLRGCRLLLEIVFVGQCEVFVCPRFGHFILAVKLIGLRTGCQIFKNVDFSDLNPLNSMFLLRLW